MITIFTTGGTFDKIYFDALSEFKIGEPQAKAILIEANINKNYHIESILKKDSLDIDDADRLTIQQAVQSSTSKHIIVTHGTDSMVNSASAIADFAEGKTVVFVGAMQPAITRQSDAHFNLGFAMAAVQLLPTGVYIAMNGEVFPYQQVKKNRAKKQFISTA